MKLCIPTMTNQGLGAEICGHFGSAPRFALYDQQTQTVEYLANHKAEHEHGECRPMDLLAQRDLGAVLCKGMGKSAIATVERQGIKVFATSGATVREAIDEFMSGRLVKLDAETGCKGHACH
jgi:predicted Fe-Mo cluster-binding NifX family protein